MKLYKIITNDPNFEDGDEEFNNRSITNDVLMDYVLREEEIMSRWRRDEIHKDIKKGTRPGVIINRERGSHSYTIIRYGTNLKGDDYRYEYSVVSI